MPGTTPTQTAFRAIPSRMACLEPTRSGRLLFWLNSTAHRACWYRQQHKLKSSRHQQNQSRNTQQLVRCDPPGICENALANCTMIASALLTILPMRLNGDELTCGQEKGSVIRRLQRAITLMCGTLQGNGGEGEIRTPDSLTTMPDFESGVVSTTAVFTIICGAILLRCYLECHINLRNLVGGSPGTQSIRHTARGGAAMLINW